MTKTCGYCKYYCNDSAFCSRHGVGWKNKSDAACKDFQPIPKITNGDKIIAGGMRAIAELDFGNKCARCIYSTYEEDVGFGEAGWICNRPYKHGGKVF